MDLVQFLSELVKIDSSINPSLGVYPSDEAYNYTKKYAVNLGFKVLELPRAVYPGTEHELFPLVVYKKGSKKGKTILFLGHLDVVPVPEDENWEFPAFSGTVNNGNLYGRGASDMKGGIAAFFKAFEGEITHGSVVIALSADEEVGGQGSMPPIIEVLRKNSLLPDFVINAEPSKNNIIVSQRRGGTWIKYAFNSLIGSAKGIVKTKTFQSVQSDGSQTLHSSAFILGADIHAFIAAAKFSVDRLIIEVASSSIKENAVPQTVSVTYIDDSEEGDSHSYNISLSKMMTAIASIGSLNLPIIPSKYGSSICPNVLTLGERIELLIDIRAMLKDSNSHKIMAENIMKKFRDHGLSGEYEITSSIDPVYVNPESFLPQKLREVAENLGMNIIDVGEKLGGASDTRYFTSLGIPGVELGPEGKNEHGPNEYVNLESLERLVKIFANVYEELQLVR